MIIESNNKSMLAVPILPNENIIVIMFNKDDVNFIIKIAIKFIYKLQLDWSKIYSRYI